MEITLNRSAVANVASAKRANIVTILIALLTRVYKSFVYPALDFISDVIMFPIKFIVVEWKFTLLLIITCFFVFFLLVNVAGSLYIMNG